MKLSSFLKKALPMVALILATPLLYSQETEASDPEELNNLRPHAKSALIFGVDYGSYSTSTMHSDGRIKHLMVGYEHPFKNNERLRIIHNLVLDFYNENKDAFFEIGKNQLFIIDTRAQLDLVHTDTYSVFVNGGLLLGFDPDALLHNNNHESLAGGYVFGGGLRITPPNSSVFLNILPFSKYTFENYTEWYFRVGIGINLY